MNRGISSLVVFHVAERSGAALSLRPRLEWLAERGSLTVATPGPGPTADLYRDIAQVRTLGYEAITLPASAEDMAAAWSKTRSQVSRFRGLMREVRPDLVICVSAMLPAALLAARLEGIPSLVHASELLARDPTRRAVARAGGWALARMNARFANGIAACSMAVADEYATARIPLEVTYPAIAEVPVGDGASMRDRLEVPAGAPLIVSLGSISKRRGQDVLVRAMRTVLRASPDARCVIFGDAFPRASDLAFRETLDSLVSELGLGGRVFIRASTHDPAAAYAAADLVVNPARVAESFGRVACEALLAGTPVVSSRVGAVPEVLHDGETALLVAADRPPDLAGAILDVLRDPELGRRLAERGAADVRSRFGPSTGLPEFRRLVGTVLPHAV
jgi:glycosyltransferase involved in cell wall biosynthesis